MPSELDRVTGIAARINARRQEWKAGGQQGAMPGMDFERAYNTANETDRPNIAWTDPGAPPAATPTPTPTPTPGAPAPGAPASALTPTRMPGAPGAPNALPGSTVSPVNTIASPAETVGSMFQQGSQPMPQQNPAEIVNMQKLNRPRY